MAVNTELHLGGLLSFADYFFDNLFVDWMVQDKIRKAETQVKDGLNAVRSTMRVLKNQIQEHKVKLEHLERRYCEHIERAD
ncbi:hypothetical protein [Paenibacillus sp. OK003]|uniref:hypothetical protein n=1 Tax=Paenibacillus sp. OK003 TaxID=1884380 RepID=UPI0008CB3CA1|nr:hypothetical protein [Paenibacillus sp. OK003]SEL57545.1 hypothetical protein SAMN05518856_113126 [Paenibacillus sp. OK003]